MTHCLNLFTANSTHGGDDDDDDIQKELYDSLFSDDTTEETDEPSEGS